MGLLRSQTLREEIPQVRLHPNAKLTPVAPASRGALILVRCALEELVQRLVQGDPFARGEAFDLPPRGGIEPYGHAGVASHEILNSAVTA